MSQRILITGGSSGLGKALALKWASEGARVCIADINDERGKQVLAQIEALGGEGLYCHCDITRDCDVLAVREQLKENWQGVDVVINNAGVATGGSITGEPIKQWQWIIDINLLGMVRVCQTFIPQFQQQGHGYFVNIASQAGLTPIPLMASYNSVKAAVIGLSETMKLELDSDNIGISVACPSFFKTNLNESMQTREPAINQLMGRFFERAQLTAEQIADTIYNQVEQRRFLILTHPEGVKAWRLKRLLPGKLYLKQMIKQTAKLKKWGTSHAQQ